MALAEVGARLRLQGAQAYNRQARDAADSTSRLGRESGQAERNLRGMGGAARRAGSALGSIGKAGAIGAVGAVAVGVGGLSVALFQGFKDAAALQTMMAKTNAVITSTNGAARVSAKGVLSLADELESLSGIDGDAIINAQNLLLTFTQVKNGTGELNHVFDQATKTAVDMAAALGSDPSAAAMQLGKALNDPIKGVSALSKVGVSFTAGQKKTIKSLVDSGKVMDAQKIILKELQVEFGGAAEAAGSGFEGSMARAKDAVGDLFRDLATPMLPVVTKQAERFSNYINDKLAPRLTKFAEGFADGTGAGGRLRDRLKEMWPQLQNVARDAGTVLKKIGSLVQFMIDHETAVKTFAIAVAGYAVAVKAVATAGALAAGVKWLAFATGITATGTAGVAGAAGVATFGASLKGLLIAGGPVLAAIAALSTLAYLMKTTSDIGSGGTAASPGYGEQYTDPKTGKPVGLPPLTPASRPLPAAKPKGGRGGVPYKPPYVYVPPRKPIASDTASLTGKSLGGPQPIIINNTTTLDGKVVAKNTVQHLRDEVARR